MSISCMGNIIWWNEERTPTLKLFFTLMRMILVLGTDPKKNYLSSIPILDTYLTENGKWMKSCQCIYFTSSRFNSKNVLNTIQIHHWYWQAGLTAKEVEFDEWVWKGKVEVLKFENFSLGKHFFVSKFLF